MAFESAGLEDGISVGNELYIQVGIIMLRAMRIANHPKGVLIQVHVYRATTDAAPCSRDIEPRCAPAKSMCCYEFEVSRPESAVERVLVL